MATYSGNAKSDYLFANDNDTFFNFSVNTRSKSFAPYVDESIVFDKWVISTGVTTTNIALS